MDAEKKPRRQLKGAPSKKTPDRVSVLLNLLAEGNYRATAIRAAGITKETFSRWLREDHAFSDAVEKAEAQALAWHLANIKRAATDGTWQASAWYLERKAPGDWGRQDRRPEGVEQVEIRLRWEEDKQEGGDA